MRICVTGGLGFIGSYTVRELIKQGYEVIVLDVRSGKVPENAELIIADITDYKQVLQALSETEANIVLHLAGTVLNIARKNPHLATRLDILGTANILEACARSDVEKIIYASSFYIYDGLSPNIRVNEKDHSNIFRAEMFGVVKLVGERLIYEYVKRYNLKYVILRYGPVYGPHERCSSLIYEFIKEGLKGKPIVVWGKGERKNQYTYIEDIALGNVKAINAENEIYNLISPRQYTIREIAEMLRRKYGFKVEYDLSKKEGPSMPYISSKKAIEKLNWNPVSLEEGIEKTLRELRKLYER